MSKRAANKAAQRQAGAAKYGRRTAEQTFAAIRILAADGLSDRTIATVLNINLAAVSQITGRSSAESRDPPKGVTDAA